MYSESLLQSVGLTQSFRESVEEGLLFIKRVEVDRIIMGPKVKRAPKNAFTFYLEEYVKSVKEQGRSISLRLATEECGPIWRALPQEEKLKYHRMAVNFKEYSKQDKANKFTSTGISHAELERQQNEQKQKVEKEDNEIKLTISNLDSELLRTHFFYLIHCNYYCKTDEGMYVPGELAISEFNLEDGVRRTFHTLINPGSIPLGYAFQAKQSTEEIHGLPYPPYDLGNTDYLGILHEISDFLEPGMSPEGEFPPFYTVESNVKACESVLQMLCDSRGDGSNFFRVYRLDKMFFWLKNKCVEYVEDEFIGFPVLSNAEGEITKDVFCYTPGISCTFHSNSEEKYHNCSLSVVQRFVYLLCDHCCQHLEIDLIPGRHCRWKCDPNREGTAAEIHKSFSRKRAFPHSEAGERESETASSYADVAGSLDWRREKSGAGSFLHEELESTYGRMDALSVSSISTVRPLSSYAGSTTRRRGRKKEEEEESISELEGNLKKVLTLGRGVGFR